MNLPSKAKSNNRKGIYLIPNMITLGSLFASFYAIIMAMNSNYKMSVLAIFAAIILDGLDGRIARLTNTQSAFGVQMDSLADMVSFGAAPALIIHIWTLAALNRWGWMAAFIYCACAALRLARFNVNTSVVDKSFFQGLPSPPAASLLISFIGLTTDSSISQYLYQYDLTWFCFGLTLFAGLSMVTNIPFYSFKDFQTGKSVPFVLIVSIVLLVALISLDPFLVIWLLAMLYAISGYIVYGWKKYHGLPTSLISTSITEPEERGLHIDD